MPWSHQQQAITRITIFIDLFLWRYVGSPGANELNEKLHNILKMIKVHDSMIILKLGLLCVWFDLFT